MTFSPFHSCFPSINSNQYLHTSNPSLMCLFYTFSLLFFADFEIVPNSALCSTATTCDQCMVIHPSCAWCQHPVSIIKAIPSMIQTPSRVNSYSFYPLDLEFSSRSLWSRLDQCTYFLYQLFDDEFDKAYHTILNTSHKFSSVSIPYK